MEDEAETWHRCRGLDLTKNHLKMEKKTKKEEEKRKKNLCSERDLNPRPSDYITLYKSYVFYFGRIRTLVAMATYCFHRLIMGKVEIDNFCQVIGDI